MILAFFFMVGGIHATMELAPPTAATHIHNQIQDHQEASIIGTLLHSPEVGPDKTKMLMRAEQIITHKGRRASSGLIKLALPGAPPEKLLPGDTFIARARLSHVTGYGVPGVFEYQEYLAYQNIWVTGWISSPKLMSRINQTQHIPFTEKIAFLPEVIRYRISKKTNQLPADVAGIYKAILIGDRSGLTPETTEHFKSSGVIHLLAISGMHMGILALFSGFLFHFMLLRSEWIILNLPSRKIATLLTVIPLTCYALIAGFHTPVLRSLIMIIVFIGAILCNRQWSIFNNLAIAALLILTINPGLLFTASFQLSFAAVAAISLFTPQLTKLFNEEPAEHSHHGTILKKIKKWGLVSIFISLSATLGTAPILAYHFNRISVLSPIGTLLIEPFLCLWSLILGLAACVTLPLPFVPDFLLHIGSFGIIASTHISSALATLPFNSIWLPNPGFIEIIAWYCALLLFAHWQKIDRKLLFISLAICLMMPLLLNHYLSKETRNTSEISILDVGQGSAIVLELAGGQTVVIDGGQRHSGKTSHFNAGKDIIAPFLWSKKIDKIDMLVVSHPHADHYSGLPFILEKFNPDTLWVNTLDFSRGEESYQDLIQLAKRLKIPIKIPAKGEKLFEHENIRLVSLAKLHLSGWETPTSITADSRDRRVSKDSNQNNQGLLLQLEHGNRSFLFPGDIESQAELSIAPELKPVDVLVAPHHGSKTSSSPNFINALMPRFIAISAGRFKPGRFPSTSVVEYYKKMGSKVLLTAQSGSIFFKTDGKDLTVETYYKQPEAQEDEESKASNP